MLLLIGLLDPQGSCPVTSHLCQMLIDWVLTEHPFFVQPTITTGIWEIFIVMEKDHKKTVQDNLERFPSGVFIRRWEILDLNQ